MATVTKFATAASGTSWTTPANANADDGAYATYTIAAKNTTGNVNSLSNFGFDAAIPSGSTINSVSLEVQHKVSTTSGIAFLESALAIGATVGTFNSDGTEPLTDTIATYSNMARPGGGSWTRADLLDGTFTVKLQARSGNNATSVIYSWDYAKVTVDYSAPVHSTTGALTGPSSTVSGSAARTRVHDASGAPTGAGSSIAGTSAHIAIHATSGAITGSGAAITGTAAHVAKHDTSGAIAGPGTVIAGAATRTRAHAASGALSGPGTVIAGAALAGAGQQASEPVSQGGGRYYYFTPSTPKKKSVKKKKDERDTLRIDMRSIVPVLQTGPIRVLEDIDSQVQALRRVLELERRRSEQFMRDLDEDEAIALLLLAA